MPCRGRHCGGVGSEHREGPLGGARGPTVCVDVGVQTEGKRGRPATFPRSLLNTVLSLCLSPSLPWIWPASRTFSQSGVVTGLPAGLDVLPAFQRVYDRLQMCLQEHTVPKAEINAGLTAVQAHPRERGKRKQKLFNAVYKLYTG